MEPIKKLTAAVLLIAFTASASTNDFYTVNVYVGGKFKFVWQSPTVPPLNSAVKFNFPKYAGPVLVDNQVWHSDTPNTLDLLSTEAVFQNGGYIRLTNAPPVVLTNWFDTVPIANTNAYQFMTNTMSWDPVVLSRAGTVVALRIGLGGIVANNTALKMAIYGPSSNLVSSGSTTLRLSDAYTIKTIFVSPRPVQAGTNYLAFAFNTGGSTTVAIRSPGNSWDSGIKYTAFPPSILPNATNASRTHFMSADLQ